MRELMARVISNEKRLTNKGRFWAATKSWPFGFCKMVTELGVVKVVKNDGINVNNTNMYVVE